jgi:hypothetical protein
VSGTKNLDPPSWMIRGGGTTCSKERGRTLFGIVRGASEGVAGVSGCGGGKI